MWKKVSKRATSMLLAIAILVGCLPAIAIPVEAGMAVGSVVETDKRTYQKQMAMDTLLYNIKGNTALTEVEKALLLHDRLILWCEYDESLRLQYTHAAEGAAINRIAVCEAYALFYKELLDAVGIQNKICVSHQMNHAWNVVFIENAWYHVDTTWGDPTADTMGRVEHRTFLVSDNKLRQEDHNYYDFMVYRTNEAAPRCTSTKYDAYYWRRSEAAFQLLNGQIYYIDHTAQTLNNATTGRSLIRVADTWESTQQGSYWDGNFSRLDTDGTYLYYTSSKHVYRYDPVTGISSRHYSPTQCNRRGYDIFEFMIDMGRMFICIKSDPNLPTLSGNNHIICLDAPAYVGLYENKGWWYLQDEGKCTGLVSHCGQLYYVKDNGWDVSFTGLSGYNGNMYYVRQGKADASFTGLCPWSGKQHYVVNGIVDNLYDGAVAVNGIHHYVRHGTVDTTVNGLQGNYLFKNGVQNTAYTGLYSHNNSWIHIEKGVHVAGYTGLSVWSGKSYLMEQGVLNTTFTGLYPLNGTWYHLEKGVLNTAYNGLAAYGDRLLYIKSGKWDGGFTGQCSYKDVWYYVSKGEVKKSHSGLSQYKNDYYLITNGKRNTTFNGLYKYNGKWYYLKKGKWQKNYTGLVKKGSALYYVKNGKRTSKYTGLCKYGSSWYYVSKGVVNKKYNGIVTYKKASYLVKNGKKNTTTSGLYKVKNTWYYLKKGKVDTSRTGLYQKGSATYYLKKGKQSASFTGLAKKGKTTYYVKKGKVDLKYTGLADKGGTRYYVKKGKVSTATSGFVKIKGDRYLIKKGKINGYTGLYKNGKDLYYLFNGEWKPNCSTLAEYKGKTYLVQNGKVDFSYYGTVQYVSGGFYRTVYVYGGVVAY